MVTSDLHNVKKKDGVATQARILRAAIAEFSATGPAGARIDAIAAAAGVNKRMLYHYFGNKAGLYQAVLDSAVANAERQPSPQDLRLLAWAGLHTSASNSTPAMPATPLKLPKPLKPPKEAPATVDDELPELLAKMDAQQVQRYLALSLQLMAELGEPLLAPVLGLEDEPNKFRALQQTLHTALLQQLQRALAPEQLGQEQDQRPAKQKVTLRAASRSHQS